MISPMYRIRGYPYRLMAFQEDGSAFKWKIIEEPYEVGKDGLIRCIAIGNGCTLVNMNVYRSMLKVGDNNEWYRTGKHHTEDTYFCAKARNAIPTFQCAVDTTFGSEHMLGVTWLNEENKRYCELKVRLVDAIVKDPVRMDELELLINSWNAGPVEQLKALDFDGSIGRL